MKKKTGLIIFLLLLIAVVCYIIYDELPSKYTKLEESFEGFMGKSLFRFEFEKSPLHNNYYGATGTGKTYFVRHYLKLYLDQEGPSALVFERASGLPQQKQKQIVIICRDEKDWIDPETGEPYAGFDMGDINMITMKNILRFKNKVFVLDDIGDKFNRDIVHYFTEGRNKNIQMIVMCHKPAHINNMARMNCGTIYITTYSGADLFQILIPHIIASMTSMV